MGHCILVANFCLEAMASLKKNDLLHVTTNKKRIFSVLPLHRNMPSLIPYLFLKSTKLNFFPTTTLHRYRQDRRRSHELL